MDLWMLGFWGSIGRWLGCGDCAAMGPKFENRLPPPPPLNLSFSFIFIVFSVHLAEFYWFLHLYVIKSVIESALIAYSVTNEIMHI